MDPLTLILCLLPTLTVFVFMLLRQRRNHKTRLEERSLDLELARNRLHITASRLKSDADRRDGLVSIFAALVPALVSPIVSAWHDHGASPGPDGDPPF